MRVETQVDIFVGDNGTGIPHVFWLIIWPDRSTMELRLSACLHTAIVSSFNDEFPRYLTLHL